MMATVACTGLLGAQATRSTRRGASAHTDIACQEAAPSAPAVLPVAAASRGPASIECREEKVDVAEVARGHRTRASKPPPRTFSPNRSVSERAPDLVRRANRPCQRPRRLPRPSLLRFYSSHGEVCARAAPPTFALPPPAKPKNGRVLHAGFGEGGCCHHLQGLRRLERRCNFSFAVELQMRGQRVGAHRTTRVNGHRSNFGTQWQRNLLIARGTAAPPSRPRISSQQYHTFAGPLLQALPRLAREKNRVAAFTALLGVCRGA